MRFKPAMQPGCRSEIFCSSIFHSFVNRPLPQLPCLLLLPGSHVTLNKVVANKTGALASKKGTSDGRAIGLVPELLAFDGSGASCRAPWRGCCVQQAGAGHAREHTTQSIQKRDRLWTQTAVPALPAAPEPHLVAAVVALTGHRPAPAAASAR